MGFELYMRVDCIDSIIGAKLYPIGVARNVFGKSTISLGIPSPIKS
jgi:hypothetical protein